MRKTFFWIIASVSLGFPASAHAVCYGETEPIAPITPSGHVCGKVNQFRYNGYSFYEQMAGTSFVKICPAGAPYWSSSCMTTSTGTVDVNNNSQVQAFNFRNYRYGATSYADFDLYAWGYHSSDYWGSDTKPIYRISANGSGRDGIVLKMPPRPLDPTPIYPSGSNVPDQYTVRWKSGIDLDRSRYLARYAVWYKHWPEGGVEPSTWTLSRANMPCQDDGSGPDANNQCSTYVAGPQPPGNWRWYVVANLNVGSVLYFFPSTIFTTQSGGVYFFQPQ